MNVASPGPGAEYEILGGTGVSAVLAAQSAAESAATYLGGGEVGGRVSGSAVHGIRASDLLQQP